MCDGIWLCMFFVRMVLHYSCIHIHELFLVCLSCHIQTVFFCMLSFTFQMPRLLAANVFLPDFPNIWPYNTERFFSAELGVKLMMLNKLVVKAKKSEFFVIANGPCPDEALVCWQVHVNNVKKRVVQHKKARQLLADIMYKNTAGLNGHA